MSRYFPTPGEFSHHTVFGNVQLRTCAGDRILFSLAALPAGSVVERHSHPHEQCGYVIEGRVVFTIGDEEQTLGPGDVFRIPGDVPHKVVTLDAPAKVLDVFSPVRDDYR